MKPTINIMFNPYSKYLSNNKRGLILMDNSRAHINDEIKSLFKQYRYDVFTLPPNLTSDMQPLDLCFNKYFKTNYEHCWEEYIIKNLYE